MKKTLPITFFLLVILLPTKAKAQQIAFNEAFVHQDTRKKQKTSDEEPAIIVYPNPAKEYIVVKSKDPEREIKTVKFYTILGTLVNQFHINDQEKEIKLQNMKKGKYLLEYTMKDNTQQVIQIIKQ